MRSNNPKVNTLMETGTRFLQVGDLKGALGVFTEMIRIEPSFAEGACNMPSVVDLSLPCHNFACGAKWR